MNSNQVLEIFKTITTIPRESGREGPVTDFLCQWAADHGLKCKKDATGNVCIIKEAAAGKEDVPVMVLQAHQDMVCEKTAGSCHDFLKDPIPYVIEDGWMVAKETTLGADDGIGIAACLALLENEAPMGRMECVFTISEETGMDGAEAMEEGFFTGKTLINLDSEDEGELFIGCAGGENTTAVFRYGTELIRGQWSRVRLCIDGAAGGHSGDDINKGRANAVQLMARFLETELSDGLQLILLTGGGKSNAIARECEAVIAVPDADATLARYIAYGDRIKEELKAAEPTLRFSASASFFNEKAVDSDVAASLIRSMASCPHGVISMSPDIPGLVQTSSNLAAVNMQEFKVIKVVTSQRSSCESELDGIVKKVSDNFRDAGAEVFNFSRYPGWEPRLDSEVLKASVESYKRLFNEEPKVKAIHAGLECGLFLKKFPGLDMISFGPTLRGVHAPGEKLDLASLDKFVLLLDDIVCNFK